MQLLQDDRVLAVLESDARINIYVERMHGLEKAIATWKPNKTLIREKLVSSLILTFDESRRMLVLCFIDDKACIFYFTSNLHPDRSA